MELQYKTCLLNLNFECKIFSEIGSPLHQIYSRDKNPTIYTANELHQKTNCITFWIPW